MQVPEWLVWFLSVFGVVMITGHITWVTWISSHVLTIQHLMADHTKEFRSLWERVNENQKRLNLYGEAIATLDAKVALVCKNRNPGNRDDKQ